LLQNWLMYVAFTLVDRVGIMRMTIGTGAGSGSCYHFYLWGLRSWCAGSKLSCKRVCFFFLL